MSTNNTVPVNWDNQFDNRLLNDLFPTGIDSDAFNNPSSNTKNLSDFQGKSAWSKSPLSKDGNYLKTNVFSSSKTYTYNNFEIIVNQGSNFNPPDKIKPIETSFYWDSNGNDKFGDTVNGISDKYAFTVKLFISKIAKELKDLYEDPTVIPAPKEILLFLEDNTNDWSGTTLYIKKGRDVQNLDFINRTMADNKNFTDYVQENYSISLSNLKELLRNGKVENIGLNIISALFEVASYGITDSFILEGIADVIKTVNKKIKETCTIDDKNWNPAKVESESKFEPLLFPNSNSFLDQMDDSKINQSINDSIGNLKNHFDEYDAKIKAYLTSDLGVIYIPIPSLFPYSFTPSLKKVDLIPNTFEEYILQKYEKLSDILQTIINQLPALDFSDMIKEGINVVNAFLCGIWNGFIEAICGIISLVQYLFEGAEFISDLLENFKEKGPAFMEKIDDCITAFQNIDFGKIFTKLAANFVDFIKNGANVSLVEVAYFIGACVGFVIELAIEIVIGILFTGGVLTIEAVIAKIGEMFKAIASLLTGAIKGAVKLTKKTVSAFAAGFDWLIEFLLKGTDEIIRIIDEVFTKIKEVSKLIGDQIELFIKNLPSNIGKSVDSLTKKFPKLQKKIVNKLLVLEFKGKTLMKINPKGIIVEIKYFRELDNYLTFTELKNVKIELEVVDDLGRKTIKKYEDTIEVLKKGDDVGFRAKFEEGKIRDGEYINYTFEKSGNYNPFAVKPTKQSKVVDKFLKEGDEFFIVEFKDRGLQRNVPGAWASNYKVKSIKELREKLQVLKKFKDEVRGELVVRKYKVKPGVQLESREGFIGHLETGQSTGPKQWEFINSWDENTFNELIQQVNVKTIK